jgi:hypothetical protein
MGLVTIEKISKLKSAFYTIQEQNLNTFISNADRVRDAYTRYGVQYGKERLIDFKARFRMAKQNFGHLATVIAEIEKQLATHFNIFQVLHIGHLEQFVHSALIAELLNPQGKHGQKALFLRGFLEDVLGLGRDVATAEGWTVRTELDRIDIRLENRMIGKAIFIENKTYTDAHSKQLSRYFEIWKIGFSKGSGAFVYLSVNGGEPGEEGFNLEQDAPYHKETILSEIKCISYKNHIIGWLKSVLPYVQAPRVKETVAQYIDVLATL